MIKSLKLTILMSVVLTCGAQAHIKNPFLNRLNSKIVLGGLITGSAIATYYIILKKFMAKTNQSSQSPTKKIFDKLINKAVNEIKNGESHSQQQLTISNVSSQHSNTASFKVAITTKQ